MIILVAVTLNIALGENGLIAKAKETRAKQEEQTIYEDIQGMMELNNNGEIDADKTVDNVKAKYPGTELSGTTLTVPGKFEKYKYIMTSSSIVFYNTEQSGKFDFYVDYQELNSTNSKVGITISFPEDVIFLNENEAVSLMCKYCNKMLGAESIKTLKDIIVYMYYNSDEWESHIYEDVLKELNVDESTDTSEVFKMLCEGSSIQEFVCRYIYAIADIEININGEKSEYEILYEDHEILFYVNGNGSYNVQVEADGLMATKVVEVNSGNVLGRYVKYDSDGDGSLDDELMYRVLYVENELGEGYGAQIVTTEVLEQDRVILGYRDPTIPEEAVTDDFNGDGDLNLEKAIYSYNNAVKTLNEKCASLVTQREGITYGVRSIGSDPKNPMKNTDKYLYESDIPEYEIGKDTWFKDYNGVIKTETNNQDRNYQYCETLDKYYWIANIRNTINVGGNVVSIEYKKTGKNTFGSGEYQAIIIDFWNNNAFSHNDTEDNAKGVRPVVMLIPGVLTNATGKGTVEDPLILTPRN